MTLPAILKPADLAKPFDGMAAGTFTDMFGRDVIIRKEDLSTYVANTMAAIERTRTESGELLGLPIDIANHDKSDGAGWIIGVQEAEITTADGETLHLIRFTANWTEEGEKLIRKNIRRMFSPTISMEEKVILGGSLTNWPATREKNGRIMLRPIELAACDSAYQFTWEETPKPEPLEEPTTMTLPTQLTEEELQNRIGAAVTAALGEMEQRIITSMTAQPNGNTPPPTASGETPPDDIFTMLNMEEVPQQLREAMREGLLRQYEEMRTAAGREAASMLAGIRHEQNVTEFCQMAISGSPQVPIGLPVDLESLTKFTKSLSRPQWEQFKSLIQTILKQGLVEFTELGVNGDVNKPKLKPLPEFYVSQVRRGELTVEDLRNPILRKELGDLAQYDLAEFAKK